MQVSDYMALRDSRRKLRQGAEELEGTGLTELVGKTRTEPERGASPRGYHVWGPVGVKGNPSAGQAHAAIFMTTIFLGITQGHLERCLRRSRRCELSPN